MKESYGMMVGPEDAVAWVEALDVLDKHMQERVVHRMRYEFDKDIPVPVRAQGGRYRSYSCGNCGAGISEVHWTFCPNCGFRIDWTKK